MKCETCGCPHVTNAPDGDVRYDELHDAGQEITRTLKFTIKKKVVGMLYILLRDHMPFGELAQMLRQNVYPVSKETTYTNEILLSLAEDLYNRFIEK